MSIWRHVKAFILMPFLGIFAVPVLILVLTDDYQISWSLFDPLRVIISFSGCILIILGLILLFKTTQLFSRFGEGTLAPWDPAQKLVVYGVYCYVRNPMVWGVLLTVLGEVLLFQSISLFLLFLFLFFGNHILFVYSEEPELTKRFGEDYLRYMENVPRWIPRINPWTMNLNSESSRKNQNPP